MASGTALHRLWRKTVATGLSMVFNVSHESFLHSAAVNEHVVLLGAGLRMPTVLKSAVTHVFASCFASSSHLVLKSSVNSCAVAAVASTARAEEICPPYPRQ
jgi:hypothetical protein